MARLCIAAFQSSACPRPPISRCPGPPSVIGAAGLARCPTGRRRWFIGHSSRRRHDRCTWWPSKWTRSIRSFSIPQLRRQGVNALPPMAAAGRLQPPLHTARMWKRLKCRPGRAAQDPRPHRNISRPRKRLRPRRRPQHLKRRLGRAARSPLLLRNRSQPRGPTSRLRPCPRPRHHHGLPKG